MADKNAKPAQSLPALEEANEQGFLGTKVDPTPDAAYSVAGVLADKPTPETDDKAAATADAASAKINGPTA